MRGVAGKRYYIDAPLIGGSHVTLNMRNCTVIEVAGSNCNLFRNEAIEPVATAADGAMIKMQNTVVTSLASIAVAGQSITVSGAGNGGRSPLCGVVSAIDSDSASITITKLGTGSACPAQASVNRAMINLYTRDSAVKVVGGAWQRGGNEGSGLNLHNFLIRHVDDVTIDIEGLTSTDGKYAVSAADLTDGYFRLKGLKSNSDGVHLMGPVFGCHVPELVGITGDDAFAITASDWAGYNDTSGDVSAINIGDIRAVSSANLFKVIAGIGNHVDGVKVYGGIFGSAEIDVIWIGDDVAQANTTGGTYGSIDCGLVAASQPRWRLGRTLRVVRSWLHRIKRDP